MGADAAERDAAFARFVGAMERVEAALGRVQADAADGGAAPARVAPSTGLMPPIEPPPSTSTVDLEQRLADAREQLSTLGEMATAAHVALREARAAGDMSALAVQTHALDRAELRAQRGAAVLSAFHLALSPHVLRNWVLSLEELL